LIAASLGNRTPRQCRERWRHYLQPVIKSSSWTLEEDDILRRGHAALGPKWSVIALSLPGRTEVNIKNRWTKLCRPKPIHPQRRSREDMQPIPPPLQQFSLPESQADSFARPIHMKLPPISEICPDWISPSQCMFRCSQLS
jgi:hypothetical protein